MYILLTLLRVSLAYFATEGLVLTKGRGVLEGMLKLKKLLLDKVAKEGEVEIPQHPLATLLGRYLLKIIVEMILLTPTK